MTDKIRCSAKTKKGTQCSRYALPNNKGKCKLHIAIEEITNYIDTIIENENIREKQSHTIIKNDLMIKKKSLL